MTVWARFVVVLLATGLPGFAQFLPTDAVGVLNTSPDSSLAHLRLGEALLKQRDLQAATFEFAHATQGDHQPAWTLVWGYVDLGRIFDATGQRDRAVKEYQLALDTKDDTFGALGVANMYLLKAATLDDVSPAPADRDNAVSPAILTRVDPEYSAEALLARLEGSVLISVSLARDGSITESRVLTSLGLGLDEAALAAVRRWTFTPGSINGHPAPMAMMVPVPFHLPSRVPGWHVTKIQFVQPNGAIRPLLVRADPFAPGKMSPELAEEATIDAAMSRKPDVSVSMEIDTLGNPGKIQVNAASLPMWGEDAAQAIAEWRFSAGTAALCVIELSWFAP